MARIAVVTGASSGIGAATARALAQPSRVNVDEIVVRPRDQATATDVHREERESPASP